MIRVLGAALLSGLALALYARAEWPWLIFGWVALVPWFAALDRITSLRATFFAGLLMSAALVITCYYWLPAAIHDYSGAQWGICLLVVLLLAPLLEPQFVALAMARRLVRTGKFGVMPLAPLAGAFAYVGVEWAVPKLFPVSLGHPLFGSNLLRQGADVAGVFGLSFIILLANDCVLTMVRSAMSRNGGWMRKFFASAVCLAALVLVPSGYGVLRYHQIAARDAQTDAITVGIVQAGISHYDRLAAEFGTYATVRAILDEHEELSLELLARGDIDLLVWPETVYPLTFKAPESPEAADLDLGIEEFVMGTGVPLVFGAYDLEGDKRFNAAFFVEFSSIGDDLKLHAYRKTRLFPFTEWTPPVFDNPAVRSVLPWLGHWTPGPGARSVFLTLADGRSVKIAPLICYDALDPAHAIAAVRAGGEVILTISNDSWFAYGSVPRFILILSAFRSIETRRPQLRATNTGISAVVMPTGEIVERLDLNARGVLVGSVRPESGMTLMLLFGDWFGPAALAAAFLILVLPLIRSSGKGIRRPTD